MTILQHKREGRAERPLTIDLGFHCGKLNVVSAVVKKESDASSAASHSRCQVGLCCSDSPHVHVVMRPIVTLLLGGTTACADRQQTEWKDQNLNHTVFCRVVHNPGWFPHTSPTLPIYSSLVPPHTPPCSAIPLDWELGLTSKVWQCW